MAPCGIIVWHRVAGGYNKGRNEERKNQQKGALRVADDGRKNTNKKNRKKIYLEERNSKETVKKETVKI